MTARNTAITKGLRRDLATAGLPADRLDLVRDLAKEGCRNHTIRRALGLTVPEFNRLLKPVDDPETGEQLPSPLRTALDEGHAEGADEILQAMRANARGGDQRALEFLADRVYKIGKEDGNSSDVPRVAIILGNALSPAEYAAMMQTRVIGQE